MGDDRHVFISYARRDGSERSANLDAALSQRGLRIWRDTRDIDPTKDFTSEIEKAIRSASHVVVCITADTERDDSFVRREITYALLKDRPITVVRFQDVTPPLPVVNHTWIDFFGSWESALSRLCQLLSGPAGPGVSRTGGTRPIVPFRAYLESLYDGIVNYLNSAVHAVIALRGGARPDFVMPRADALPAQFLSRALPLGRRNPNEAARPAEPVSAFTCFGDAYEEYEGRVLIVGDPGAGKTTTLMAFARDAVIQRLYDSSRPLPIMSLIETWDKSEPLARWLSRTVPLSEQEVEWVMQRGQALLLLDGLDELGAGDHMTRPQESQNQEPEDPRKRFLDLIPPDNQVVITCRTKDFEEIGERVPLAGAVALQPLTDSDLEANLKDVPELWEALARDETMRDATRTPLLLALFRSAFSDLLPGHEAWHTSSESVTRDLIFERFVEGRYQHEVLKRPLRMTLSGIYHGLGRVAANEVLAGQTIGWTAVGRRSLEANLADLLWIDSTALVEESRLLNLLISGARGELRFLHGLLRDHFCIRFSREQLRATDPVERASAAVALCLLDDAASAPLLLHLLEDDAGIVPADTPLRYQLARTVAAATWLALMGSRIQGEVVAAIIEALRQGGSLSMSSHLETLRAEVVVPRLQDALESGDVAWRKTVVRLLGRVGASRVDAASVQALNILTGLFDNSEVGEEAQLAVMAFFGGSLSGSAHMALDRWEEYCERRKRGD